VEEKFCELRDYLTGKLYTHHLVTPFFAVENSLEDDDQVSCFPLPADSVTANFFILFYFIYFLFF
jgi:hypothetical protein